MKKKNLFLIALLCAYSTLASAYTVTDNGDGSVTIDGGQWVNTTVTDNHGDTHIEVSGAEGAGLPASFNNADKALINGATKLIFTGYINNMQAFQDLAGSMIATSVDMSEAHFQQNLNSVEEVTYDKYDPEMVTALVPCVSTGGILVTSTPVEGPEISRLGILTRRKYARCHITVYQRGK